MERMTLRVAAERTLRSVTTLRRYIRSGRLRADKSTGRYGPEYLLSEEALAAAGLPVEPSAALVRRHDGAVAPGEQAFRDFVPSTLYHELQMKHEQLLVQYGMVRAGGLRVFELQGALESARGRLAERDAELAALRERASRELSSAHRGLRESELDLQGQKVEIDALREKLQSLERILESRGAGTSEAQHQVAQIVEQLRRVERHERLSSVTAPWTPLERDDEPDH